MEDYKEKYEQAMLRMSKWVEGSEIIEPKEVAEFVFPELRESEDEMVRKFLYDFINNIPTEEWNKDKPNEDFRITVLDWLEKQGEKIDAIENLDTEFEKQVSHLIASAINKEHEYNQSYVKWTANALLNYAKHELEKQGEQKLAWSEEDERIYNVVLELVTSWSKGTIEGCIIPPNTDRYTN